MDRPDGPHGRARARQRGHDGQRERGHRGHLRANEPGAWGGRHHDSVRGRDRRRAVDDVPQRPGAGVLATGCEYVRVRRHQRQ